MTNDKDAVAERESDPVDATNAERLSRLLGPSVDGQVVVAALDDGDYAGQPEWLWRNHTTGVCGFGRWSKAVGQAPYIRADIALAALAATPPTSELEALRKRVAELEKALGGLLDNVSEKLSCGMRCQLEATKEDEDHYQQVIRIARRVREERKIDG